jgi:sulfatase modifying factor 1
LLLTTKPPPSKIYSNNGSFESLPIGLRKVLELELLEDNEHIASKKNQKTTLKNKQFSDLWIYLSSEEDSNEAESFSTAAPGTTLLTTTWNQNDPYNYYCPVAAGGPGGRAYAGCSATALAQILRYHMCPTSSIFFDYWYTDVHGSCQGTHSLSDAGMEPYDWPNMPSSISASSPEVQKQAVGQLIYHCGVLLQSDYEADSTAASTSLFLTSAFREHLKYTCDDRISKIDYISTEWYSMISTDVDNNQPIYYSMYPADGSTGHAVVCDGYRNGNEIHLNMGWSGARDAWYNIDSVSANGHTWTIHNAVFNIAPILPPGSPSSITYPDISDTGQYTISWSSSIGADGYLLERSGNGGTSWSQVYMGPLLSYSESVGNGSFRYQVQAFNVGGDSSWMTGTTDCIVSISLPPNADINADNRIDLLDLYVLAQEFTNACSIDTDWCSNSDLNRSGFVDLVDFAILASQWDSIIIPGDMELIQGGTFDMGDSFYERDQDERPVHTVTLDSFCMSNYEITNQQYCDYLNSAYPAQIKVDGGVVYDSNDTSNSYPYYSTSSAPTSLPSWGEYSQIDFSGSVFSVRTKGGRGMSNDPVVVVSWYGAVAYCNWRSQQENWEQCYDLTTWTCDFSKIGFCLPTEAEWEYAARGGLSGKRYPWGDTISRNEANYGGWEYDPIWYDGIPPYTSPVGSYPPNNYGLYDMAGNVSDFCYDWYDEFYYDVSPTDNPTGPASGSWRINRGGTWYDATFHCRVAGRRATHPYSVSEYSGFRIALNMN